MSCIEGAGYLSSMITQSESVAGFGAMSVTDGPEVPQQACVCTASAYQMQPPGNSFLFFFQHVFVFTLLQAVAEDVWKMFGG